METPCLKSISLNIFFLTFLSKTSLQNKIHSLIMSATEHTYNTQHIYFSS